MLPNFRCSTDYITYNILNEEIKHIDLIQSREQRESDSPILDAIKQYLSERCKELVIDK